MKGNDKNIEVGDGDYVNSVNSVPIEQLCEYKILIKSAKFAQKCENNDNSIIDGYVIKKSSKFVIVKRCLHIRMASKKCSNTNIDIEATNQHFAINNSTDSGITAKWKYYEDDNNKQF